MAVVRALVALIGIMCAVGASASAPILKWPSHVTAIQSQHYDTQLKHVLRASDEISVFFVYDSADVNSLRVVPDFVAASEPLQGFGAFYAIDARDPSMGWLLDTWNVQILPAIRGLSWTRGTRVAWDHSPLASIGAVRTPVEWPAEQKITVANLKSFVLNMQGSAVPVTRVDSDAKVQPLLDHLQKSGAPKPVVVLVSNKGATSQLYKAVAIAFNERCEFVEVNAAKAKSAMGAFQVTEVPAVFLYNRDGVKHEFRGALTPAAFSSFISPHVESREALRERKAAATNAILQRELLRRTSPLLPIATSGDWQTDVLDSAAVTGIFFVETEAEAAARAEVVKDFQSVVGSQRTAVSKFVWIDKSKSPDLYATLAAAKDQEPADLVFVSMKRKVYQRYLGSTTGRNIADFVKGPMSRGVGSTTFDALPPFGK